MNKFDSLSPIAFDPCWQREDFIFRISQIAEKLQEDNVNSVALWFDDASRFACTLLACFLAGKRVLLPPNLLPENQAWIKQHADLLLDDLTFEQFGVTQKQQQKRPHFDVFKQTCNQTEVYLKTSGSSGEAKIIIKTAYQLWLEAEEISKVLPFDDTMPIHIVGSVSVQHLYGLTFRVMLPLFNGWIIGRQQLVYPEYLIAQNRRYDKTVWISSPALLAKLNLENKDLLNYPPIGIFSSGGALAEYTAQNIIGATGSKLIEIYGSSETGVIAFRSHKEKWQPFSDCVIGTDNRGALWVESKRIFQREQTEDAVEIGNDGFTLLGRIDRIVKLGDKRVSLVKIEQTLQQHPWVDDCYVSIHSDLQRIAAWIALNQNGIEVLRNEGRKAIIEGLKRNLMETQEKLALPRFWRFSDILPRNSQSKINRMDFEKIFAEAICEPQWIEDKKEKNTQSLRAKVPLDLVYFKGHFSAFPLVPGVVELQWVIEQIPLLLGGEVEIERIDNLKFQQFLRPNDTVDLFLEHDDIKKRINFRLKGNDQMCGSGSIILKNDEIIKVSKHD